MAFSILIAISYISVKIRPKWDWNDQLKRRGERNGRLKSDQNGIEIKQSNSLNLTQRKLKSDQNGIEIHLGWGIVGPVYELKSDQNGIEMMQMKYWKRYPHGLKSDQNGIEIKRIAEENE